MVRVKKLLRPGRKPLPPETTRGALAKAAGKARKAKRKAAERKAIDARQAERKRNTAAWHASKPLDERKALVLAKLADGAAYRDALKAAGMAWQPTIRTRADDAAFDAAINETLLERRIRLL